MNKGISLHQRIHNAIGAQEMEVKKAEHALVHALGYEREEFDKLWVKSENATWGHNFGRMIGFDEIYYNHLVDELGRALDGHKDLAERYPEYRGTDDRSAGTASVHCLSEGCIEMADDGMSGRGFFMTPGLMGGACEGYFGGGRRDMGNLWEYYGCDFVYHNNEWLYLHEHVCPVFGANYTDKNWAYEMYKSSDDDPNNTMRRPAPCKVGDPEFQSDRFNVHQVVQQLLWECPEPYETLDENHTYSPGSYTV